jgi:hypothetical protein
MTKFRRCQTFRNIDPLHDAMTPRAIGPTAIQKLKNRDQDLPFVCPLVNVRPGDSGLGFTLSGNQRKACRAIFAFGFHQSHLVTESLKSGP